MSAQLVDAVRREKAFTQLKQVGLIGCVDSLVFVFCRILDWITKRPEQALICSQMNFARVGNRVCGDSTCFKDGLIDYKSCIRCSR